MEYNMVLHGAVLLVASDLPPKPCNFATCLGFNRDEIVVYAGHSTAVIRKILFAKAVRMTHGQRKVLAAGPYAAGVCRIVCTGVVAAA